MVFPATKQDVEDHFNTHGAGKIKEIKLKAGFGFIEYDDEMDAKDVVPGETFSLTFTSSDSPANLCHFSAFRMYQTKSALGFSV